MERSSGMSVMRMSRAWLLGLLLAVRPGGAQPCQAQAPDVFRMSQEERAAYFARINAEAHTSWEAMVRQLGIRLPDFLPPPAGDPRRPGDTFQKKGSSTWSDSADNTYTRSAWGTWNNYDESKANPFPHLPDPLVLANGRPVKTPEVWWKERRPEIEDGFNREIFGRVPETTPSVHWEVLSSRDTTIGTVAAVQKELRGRVDNSLDPKVDVAVQVTLTTPANASHPVPVILEFGFVLPPGFHFPGMTKPEGPTWQEQVLARGWGCAVYIPTSVQPDNAAGLTQGIIGLVNGGLPRKPEDWGALRAWAWGASRVMDYFETDRTLDARKVGIEGISRYGKAVLVTMAYDQRFAIALVGSSGKGGATLYRRDYGESMGNICSSGEYHWFAGNLLRYVLRPDTLAVDSHELIALCAPRPVFISCGSPEVEGRWVDDRGQFMAEVAAGPVYTLLGLHGLGTTTMPAAGTSFDSGALAFRQHEGGHTVDPNWPYFLRYAREYFSR